MPFTLPTFNLTAAIFTSGLDVGGPPRLTAPCNVAFGKRATTQGWFPLEGADSVFVFLLFPRGTDVRDRFSAGGADSVEVPQGSGRFYEVLYMNDLGTGFENEHRFAVGSKSRSWPTPLPAVFEEE